jgi:2-methylcitrate dehydratase PrpD
MMKDNIIGYQLDRDRDYGTPVAEHAASARDAALAAEVVEKAKSHIIDTLAAIVSGSALEAGRAGQTYARSVGGREDASILGTRLRVPIVEAALANGMAAHADESDDSHEESLTHPGCGVLPAALAAADLFGGTGEEFLRAVVLGYEMTIRFGMAFGADMTMAKSSKASHAYGPLMGAGYAAGSLMKFDAPQFRALLNYLGQEASGLTTWRLDKAHTLKSYVFAGMPATNGVKAAALVRSGFSGGGDALAMADRNILDSICSRPAPAALVDRLGSHYVILEADIKKYPVGFPIAAPVAAVEAALAKGLSARDIERIEVRYDEHWYTVIGDASRMPDVNLRYCLAATIVDGGMTFHAAHDAQRMDDPDVVEMGKRITLLGPPAGQDRFDVTVDFYTINGQSLRIVQDRNVRGRYENPMTPVEVDAKALDLLCTVQKKADALELIEGVRRIEGVGDIRQLIAVATRSD